MAAEQQSPVCLADYERLAEQCLDANAWSYLSGAAGNEVTARWNQSRFDEVALVPRMLGGGSGGHTRLQLLGRDYAHPIFVAPLANHKLAHANGERETAMAAAAQDACMVLSSNANVAMEEAVAAGETCRWIQLYMQPSREATLQLVQRAERAGFDVLVVTVDAPVSGVRNREHRSAFQLPPGIDAVNLIGLPKPPAPRDDGSSAVFGHFLAMAPTWDDVTWLRGQTSMKLVLKGILAADDAVKALDCGADAVIVSNHGGRTLDTTLATIDALPAVARAVAGRMPILLDGGIRRGTDVLKALALGASAVLVGRPVVFGLAVNGAFGVAHVLRLLRDEFEIAMALSGCKTLAEIGPHLIHDRATRMGGD